MQNANGRNLREVARRLKKIEGRHLAIVIALNLFVAVIPPIIIGYAFISAFNPDRDVGNLLARSLHLTGSTASIVKDTFTNASSGKSVALSISLISLLITGLDVSATGPVSLRQYTCASQDPCTHTWCSPGRRGARRRAGPTPARSEQL